MIGKVLRGDDARRLLYYLYGPGRANEHADPHLVAGFDDPTELEPSRHPDESRDFRRLAGLLAQPMAALAVPGFDKPVWHCAVWAAPDDRLLSDAEWAQIAAGVMNTTGLAPEGDDLGVRWVVVRHAPDHIHIVATLARQDGARPRIWNDFYRVREACQQAERQLGLRLTAPADRTAARRATRAETEQAARRGWDEPPRTRLRREVCTAAAGARTEREFFIRLQHAGVLVRPRYSTIRPGELTGYAVGLPGHTAQDGGVVWYGGGKLAADLTLPKLRTRWARPPGAATVSGAALSAPAARAVLRNAAPARHAMRGMRPVSSLGCAKRTYWCGCGSARSIRDRQPGVPSRWRGTPGPMERFAGTEAAGSPLGSRCRGVQPGDPGLGGGVRASRQPVGQVG